jgi:tetratricopeptide (TPR) repeat protein
VGHSFTSSFALYAYLQAPQAFDAVIALSPLHLVETALPRVAEVLHNHPNDRVLMAVGGAERQKDGGHHERLVSAMQAVDPARAGTRLLLREYPSAGHTSLPIVAFPDLLSTLFMPYSLRDSLAPVDGNYALIDPPPAPDVLLKQVAATTAFQGMVIPWDIAEINGLASRLSSSGYADHAIAIYRRAIQLYPKLYEFHWSLGELLLEQDDPDAKGSIQEALRLLDSEESQLPGRMAIRSEIEALLH